MSAATIILFRSPEAQPEQRPFEDALAAALTEAGCAVVVAPHIYYLTPSHPAVARLAQIENGALVAAAWLHPRAIHWTLRALGIDERIMRECHDLRTFTSVAEGSKRLAAARLTGAATAHAAPVSVEQVAVPVSERWYPVLDYSRCAGCRQCFGFCLFGVYAVEDDRVIAARPDNCKHGCPACARVCPQGAIMFPHHDDPAIAGAPGTEIDRNPNAIAAVLERARHKRAEAQQVTSSRVHDRCKDDLGDLIDELEWLDD